MKKIKLILLSLLLLLPFTGFAQMVHSAYFLDEASRRYKMNAAFAPEYGYFSLPLLGELQLNAYTGLALNKMLFPNPNGPGYVTGLHESVSADQFLSGFKQFNGVHQNLELNLLSFGFFGKKTTNFWTFDLSLHEQLSAGIPYDLFRFLKTGMTTYGENVFDLSQFGVRQSNYIQALVGHSREINDQLRVGLNAKFLVGVGAVGADFNKFELMLSEDLVRVEADADMYLAASFIELNRDGATGDIDITNPIIVNSYNPSGMGVAFDVGAVYKAHPHVEISAAVNNIGLINWSPANMTRSNIAGSFEFEGVMFDNLEMDSTQFDGMLDMLEITESSGLSKSEPMPMDINLSVEYSVFNSNKHDVRLGLLYHGYHAKKHNLNQVVAALTLKPLSWFTVSGTADVFNPDFNKFGLALNVSPAWLNLYLASDFVTPKINRNYMPVERVNLNLLMGGFYLLR